VKTLALKAKTAQTTMVQIKANKVNTMEVKAKMV
jgi:hypothetical protein